MGKITIVTSKPNRAGLDLVIAGHNVNFNDQLEAVVEEEAAEELLQKDPSLSLPGQEIAETMPPEVKEVVAKMEEAEASEEKEEDKVESLDELNVGDEIELSDLTKKGLQEVASDAKLDKSEWGKLSKTKLIEYLKKHL